MSEIRQRDRAENRVSSKKLNRSPIENTDKDNGQHIEGVAEASNSKPSLQVIYKNQSGRKGSKEVDKIHSSSFTESNSDSEQAPSNKLEGTVSTAVPEQEIKLPLSPFKRREAAKVHPNAPFPKKNDYHKGAENMAWAKWVFYMSTERIFPGFRKSSENRRNSKSLCSTRSRSSLILGLLLLGSAYFHIPWAIGWICLFGYKLPTLKKVHGGLLFGCSVVFVVINYLRLPAGMKGNGTDDAQQLGIYWMLTSLVQFPIITFFILTDFFCPIFLPMITIIDCIAALLLIGELVVGFFHLKSIISDELKVIRLGQETWKLSTRPRTVPKQVEHFESDEASYYMSAESGGEMNGKPMNSDGLDIIVEKKRKAKKTKPSSAPKAKKSRLAKYSKSRKENNGDDRVSVLKTPVRKSRPRNKVITTNSFNFLVARDESNPQAQEASNSTRRESLRAMNESPTSLKVLSAAKKSSTNKESSPNLTKIPNNDTKSSTNKESSPSLTKTPKNDTKLSTNKEFSPNLTKTPKNDTKSLRNKESPLSLTKTPKNVTKSSRNKDSPPSLTKTPKKVTKSSRNKDSPPSLTKPPKQDKSSTNKEPSPNLKKTLKTDELSLSLSKKIIEEAFLIKSSADVEITGEDASASNESLPFSNLEEAETDYLWGMLTDKTSDVHLVKTNNKF